MGKLTRNGLMPSSCLNIFDSFVIPQGNNRLTHILPCYISVPPENVKFGFLTFSGGKEM